MKTCGAFLSDHRYKFGFEKMSVFCLGLTRRITSSIKLISTLAIPLVLVSCSDGVSVNTLTQPPLVSAEEFGDEFSTNSLSSWSLRHQVEGESAQYTVLDINQSTAGSLTIQPTITPGWFADGKAPLIYKRVSGNFSVETRVSTRGAVDPTLPPASNYNSAGLMVRAGDSSLENHVMINVGRQLDTLGSEAKNTVNSVSNLNVLVGSNNGRLILCRVGSELYAYRQLDNETVWTEVGTATRDDLPDTVQVGMVVNGFTGPDIVATFDYVRMTVPEAQDDCVSDDA